MLNDHFITLVLFSLLVACFFGVLNHRNMRDFSISIAKTMGWMVLGSVAFAYLMLWTGR